MAFLVEFIDKNPEKSFICFFAVQKCIFYNFASIFPWPVLKKPLNIYSITSLRQKNIQFVNFFSVTFFPYDPVYPAQYDNIPLDDNSCIFKRLRMQLACTSSSFG